MSFEYESVEHITNVKTINGQSYPPAISALSIPANAVVVGTGSPPGSPPVKAANIAVEEYPAGSFPWLPGDASYLRILDFLPGAVKNFIGYINGGLQEGLYLASTTVAGLAAGFDNLATGPHRAEVIAQGANPSTVVVAATTQDSDPDGGQVTISATTQNDAPGKGRLRLYGGRNVNLETSNDPTAALAIGIRGNYGNIGDVIMAGSQGATWARCPGVQILNAYIADVPAAGAWQNTVGPIPYADAIASYPGADPALPVNGRCFCSYDSSTHIFTVDATYYVRVSVCQTVEIGNSSGIGPFPGNDPGNGKIMLVDQSNPSTAIGTDTGRFMATAAMAASGMLGFNMSFDNIVTLYPNVNYQIVVKDEGPPGRGLLISKGSVTFALVGTPPVF